LVRMNDGEQRHNRPREAMLASIDGISRTMARIDAIAEQHAQRLVNHIGSALTDSGDAGAIAQLAFALPTCVIGSLLGVADIDHDELARLVMALVACLGGTSPTGGPLNPDAMSHGPAAAQRLRERFPET